MAGTPTRPHSKPKHITSSTALNHFKSPSPTITYLRSIARGTIPKAGITLRFLVTIIFVAGRARAAARPLLPQAGPIRRAVDDAAGRLPLLAERRTSRSAFLCCVGATSAAAIGGLHSRELAHLPSPTLGEFGAAAAAAAAPKRASVIPSDAAMVGTRRSARLRLRRSESSLRESDGDAADGDAPKSPERPRAGGRPRRKSEVADEIAKRKRTPRAAAAAKKKKLADDDEREDDSEIGCLPRGREKALKSKHGDGMLRVMGVDEAGRGPLAGPVVAAAAVVPHDIPGVTDSKKITKEEAREELYEKIVLSPGVRWAAAVIDAGRIDEINILQATLLGMRTAAEAVVSPPRDWEEGRVEFASAEHEGCYVVCGRNDDEGTAVDPTAAAVEDDGPASFYALVDGNRVPPDMPCEAEAMVRGDSCEFAIGAASIIAKVTRDRLMREYDERYPEYELGRHKGYPTAAHMSAVHRHGASPIHRRTFAPLKHMTFDDEGRVVEDADEVDGENGKK